MPLSTPFSGFPRGGSARRLRSLGHFQLPFRDSIQTSSRGIMPRTPFQLPFRDSSGPRPQATAPSHFQLPFRDSWSTMNGASLFPTLSTPFSGFDSHRARRQAPRLCLSTPFSGFTSIEIMKAGDYFGFQLPFRDSRKEIRRLHELAVTFNSLFGIRSQAWYRYRRRRHLSTPFSGFVIAVKPTLAEFSPFNSLFGIREWQHYCEANLSISFNSLFGIPKW